MTRLKKIARSGLDRRLRKLIPRQAVSLHLALTEFLKETVKINGFELQLLPKWAELVSDELVTWPKYYLILTGKPSVPRTCPASYTSSLTFHSFQEVSIP